MKKVISLMLALLMCLALCACGAPENAVPTESAVSQVEEAPSIDAIIKAATLQYPASNDVFKYNIYDTYVEITEYIGSNNAAEVIVPAMLNDLPVYVVDFDVFKRCEVKSIVFEDGIYKIHSDFSPFVENVVLPATLSYVDGFKNCYNLKTVVIPEGIDSIFSGTFMHCQRLKEVTIPSTVTNLNSEIFAYCTALETVNLPNGLRKIDDKAFVGCKALKTISIPASVEKLGEDVFMSSGLETIVIPETVKEVGSGLFSGCEKLSVVKVYNADMVIKPLTGYSSSILFSSCSPKLVVHGKAASTIAKQCGQENVYFELIP